MARRPLDPEDIASFMDAARSREEPEVVDVVPMEITEFFQELSHDRPLRIRSILKHLRWIEKQAKKRGVVLWVG